MKKPYRVSVFCSANQNIEPAFFIAATEFAQGLARREWELIYGGSRVGLMGHFADVAKNHGSIVRGAITEDLAADHEMPHRGLDELVFVKDLFERKRYLMEAADAFVIFPGGFGTLDEALEVITWKALGSHQKPIVFVNLAGFWQSQLDVFRGMADRGMIRDGGLELYEVADSIEGVWKILDVEN
jgi:uncharacterized protein (TIGR00730 family)